MEEPCPPPRRRRPPPPSPVLRPPRSKHVVLCEPVARARAPRVPCRRSSASSSRNMPLTAHSLWCALLSPLQMSCAARLRRGASRRCGAHGRHCFCSHMLSASMDIPILRRVFPLPPRCPGLPAPAPAPVKQSRSTSTATSSASSPPTACATTEGQTPSTLIVH
jgi:hypothetical protein